ncbi:TauD/TfdA family dioxygenase [Streptomyces sp. NPDC007189]|uniref:TauD/TfdA family dioxygenase n=1 Tax=Streptomyces sp. NPDC007189 TaxID=3154315 RepID=UPI003452B241
MSERIRLHEHRLDDGIRDLLGKEVAERLSAADFDPDRDTVILARIGAYALGKLLPPELLAAVRDFTGSGAHALLLDNLPQQEAPGTPVTGFGGEVELAVTNALHLGLIQLLGLTPFAVEYENSGKLIRNVVPNPVAAGKTSSWGSDSEFFWHTDNPHLPFGDPGSDPRPYIPRCLTFYVMRNTEQVPTEIMSVEAAVDRLPRETARVLSSNAFEIAAPDSNDIAADGSRLTLDEAAVLERRALGLRVRFDHGTTSAITPQAADALATWVETLPDAPCWQPVLAPGQFLAFDNYRVLHRRQAFTPTENDAEARWLRRCYAS